MRKLLFILLILICVCLCGCQTSPTGYIQGKLDQRESDRIQQKQYSDEAKGTNVWWNSRYDNRSTNRHLNNDQFGFGK
jgi:hypothetical protein